MLEFRESLKRDAQDFRAWFDVSAFAKVLNIDGHKVTGILSRCKPSVSDLLQGTEGYTQARFMLTVRASDISGVQAGQSVRIDGRMYVVRGYDSLQEVFYRIELVRVDP